MIRFIYKFRANIPKISKKKGIKPKTTLPVRRLRNLGNRGCCWQQNKMDDEKEDHVLKKSRHPVVFVNHVDTYVGKNISKVNLEIDRFHSAAVLRQVVLLNGLVLYIDH